MKHMHVETAVQLLTVTSRLRSRNLQMPGDPHYQPAQLQPYLGYDQRAGWLVLVEWFWMQALACGGVMPESHARLLTENLLRELLAKITMAKVAKLERAKTNHDILALLELMRRILPSQLHRWLHLGLTSYDIICTAYALQARFAFFHIFRPKLVEVDILWRSRIRENADVLQIGRTHLQDALPITVGAWLAPLHNRFVNTARRADTLACEIPGKFSGAVGTGAAIRVFGEGLESFALSILGLPAPRLSSQIVQPECLERFYNEIMLISAVLANLGDDVRHLQASAIREVMSESSTSSTISSKDANPIFAEQADGMHVSVRLAFMAVVETLNSTLQRDLRFSNVMRSFTEIIVLTYKQLQSAERVLKTLEVNKIRCQENFWRIGKLTAAELLHLTLQKEGYPNAHRFVNKRIVPAARESGNYLCIEMGRFMRRSRNACLKQIWRKPPGEIRYLLANPNEYIGDAVKIARAEAENALAA